MANGVRTYQIKINGLTESISAVDSLNKQLDALDKKITALQGKAVNVSAASSGGGGGSTSALSEDEKILKQKEQTEQKILAIQKEQYQELLNQKDILKDTQKTEASRFASDNLAVKEYSNTLLGLKDRLHDIKAAMQTEEIGNERFNQLSKEAGEITQKLKEIEASYGTFSRNVGNYASAAEGFKGLKIDIGGISEEFENARQAYMTLKREMQTLATKKDLGIITDEETERLKSLIPTVKQLESSIQDAGKPMDRLMDSMQSIVAIAQAGKGLAAFFGLEDTGIEKSIQDLVALQNAMQGLQTIQKQLQAGDGIFKWLNKGNASIDNFTKKLFGVKKATTEVTTASKAQAAATSTVATASKGAATAEVAQTTATAGLTVGMGAATVAAKLLSTALKAIGIGILLEGISLAIDGIKSLVSWITSESDAEKKAAKAAKEHADMVKAGSEAYANAAAKVKQYQLRIDAFNGSAQQEKKLVEELNNEFGNQIGKYKSLEEWKKALIEQAPAYLETLKNEAILTQLAAKYAEIYAQKLQMLEKFKIMPSMSRDAIEKYFDEQLSGVEQMMAEVIEDNQTLYDTIGNAASGAVTTIKNTNNDILEAEKDLYSLRIQNMKEGLNKILAQLEEERKAKLAKIRQSGILVAERELEVNKHYDKKIEEEKKKHAAEIEKITGDMYEKLYKLGIDNLKRQEELTVRELQYGTSNKSAVFNQNISSYGVQGKRTFSQLTASKMGIYSNDDSDSMKRSKQLMDISRQVEAINNVIDTVQAKYDNLIAKEKEASEEEKEIINQQKEKYQDLLKRATSDYNKFASIYQLEKDKMIAIYGENEFLDNQMKLADESYSSRLSYIYSQRQTAIEKYWKKRVLFETDSAESLYKTQEKLENESFGRLYDEQRRANEKSFEEALKNGDQLLEMWKNQGLSEVEAKKAADEYYNRLYEENEKALELLTEQHNQRLKELEQEKNDSIQKINGEALQARLQEFRDFTTAINELEQKQPVLNAWGITNFKQTNENNRNLLESYEQLANDIYKTKQKLQEQLNNNEISFDDFQNANRELDRFTDDLGQKMDKVRNELTVMHQIGQFIQDIQQYIQALGNAIQTVMDANNKYQDYLFDKQQEDLDKQNDILQKKLSEQEDILQKHKSAVDSIENELSSARGDRRQHLIDQLNSEIAAQRRAAAEKEQIEKKEEALKKKQDELDKARKKAEYDRNLQSILVSGAMAISNAFATSPFVPVGLAMGALATTLTAYQYAMAKKAKPYATGGVIEGKSHKDGGVPVLGGQVTVEGGEFITNKRTTQQNTPLLEYINSKKKRIDLSDMVEFFSEKPKATIKNIRSKYANGGVLTSPNVDLNNFNDRTIIVKDDSVYQVQVVDVISKAADVKRVQVLAGLNPNNSI